MTNGTNDGVPDPDGRAPKLPAGKDYEVGYKKPPKHSQFPRGNGPGKGRPKGAKNIATIVNSVLDAKIPVKLNGKSKKISKFEASLTHVANKASQGDAKSTEQAIRLKERYGPQAPMERPSLDKLKRDRQSLKDYLAMEELIDPESEDDAHE